VAITGMRRDAGIAQGRAAGFPANLGKPVSVQRLDAEVPELLPERARRPGRIAAHGAVIPAKAEIQADLQGPMRQNRAGLAEDRASDTRYGSALSRG
jgi:hypothetical protein